MPLAATHHDNATGLLDPGQPAAPERAALGSPQSGPGRRRRTPGTLQLHGCHHIGGAPYYRLLYSYEGAGVVPFTGLEWYPPKLTGPPWFHVVPRRGRLVRGARPRRDLVFPHWLLNWPTTWYPNGKYDVQLQLARQRARTVIDGRASGQSTFMIDNRAPNACFSQVRWRPTGGSMAGHVHVAVPVPGHPSGPRTRTSRSRSAGGPARSTSATRRWAAAAVAAGTRRRSGRSRDYDHWHVDSERQRVLEGRAVQPAGHAPEGLLHASASTPTRRAFNPAGDGGGPGTDWLTDYAYSHAHPSIAVSVINS